MIQHRPCPLILNVDDDEASRYALNITLRRQGYDVVEACTGQEALRLAVEHQPDLVLLDIRLPDMDGFEVCRKLRSDASTAGTAVLHLSASFLDSSSVAKGLNTGADAYLTEPVDPLVLDATMRALLRARAAEQTLRSTAREWQSTFDAIFDGVAVLDAAGIIVRTNRALADLVGRDLAELPGTNWFSIFSPDAGPNALQPSMQSGRREVAERTHEGTLVRISCDPMRDDRGEVTGYVMIASDITEQRRLQEMMGHAQRLESIGLLAGGVAHDFNNLLTGILGNAGLALDYGPRAEVADHLQSIILASERAADLAGQLLAYAGKGRYDVRTTDVQGLIRKILPLIQAAVSRKVEVVFDLQSGVPPVEADATQLRQLIMNLVMNGAEAIGDAPGTIRVSVRSADLDAAEVRSRYLGTDTPVSGTYVMIRVSDTGCGLDEETQSRLFDPFFTTKFLGRGLGLAAALGIVRQHQGGISVQSRVGEGTTFDVVLPASSAKAGRPKAAAVSEGPRKKLILVVDDEEMVRKVARVALERAGFEIELAEHGKRGVDLFAERPTDFSIVLLDLSMPVMSGEDALAEILRLRPDAQVLVLSGYAESEVIRKCGGRRIAGFVQKPFTGEQLIRKVREALVRAGAETVTDAPQNR